MTVAELVKKLAAMFPRGFGGTDGLEGWEAIYRDALGRLSREALADAYRAVMATWIKSGPPKPGDFLIAAGGYSSQRGAEGHVNRKAIEDDVFRLRPILANSWWRDCSGDVDAFLATMDEADRLPARAQIRWWIADLASMAAQRQAMGMSATVTLASPDWETIRRRVASQRGGQMRVGRLRPLADLLPGAPAREMDGQGSTMPEEPDAFTAPSGELLGAFCESDNPATA